MRIGCSRVLVKDQTLALQWDALKAAGCKKVFADQDVSVSAIKRPCLDRAPEALRSGDVLVMWKLDRLGWSLSHLGQTMADFEERGIGFENLTEKIDTTSASERLALYIAAVFNEFERSLAAERTRAGIGAAKQRGQRLGGKPSRTPDQIAYARQLVNGGANPRTITRSFDVGRAFNVGRATLYGYFQKAVAL